jgi:hypothetical protein
MHLHIHKINALQDSFNTLNQTSVFKACRHQFETIGMSSTMSTGLKSLELWSAEMFDASKKEAIIGPHRMQRSSEAKHGLSIHLKPIWCFERENSLVHVYTFSQFLVQFISVLSFHRAWEHSIALHRRPSFDIDEHPWLRASLTWCLVLFLSSGIGSFNMLSWEDRKSLT